jgi:ribulose-5-phosphate 4-epimerase/fuculose-1-phosphate aldolase
MGREPINVPDLSYLAAAYPEVAGILDAIARVATQINLKGWAEANAGNASVNLTHLLPETGRAWYLVSRSGSRYREIASNPLDGLILVSIGPDGQQVHPTGARPTSEWGCHLGLQEHLAALGGECRTVLHAHPDSVILASQLDAFSGEERLNALMREALAEFPLFMPDGIAFAPSAAPGSEELALCSLQAIGTRKALIWQGHGLVCAGKTPDEALDNLEVAEKAVRMALYKFILTNIPF